MGDKSSAVQESIQGGSDDAFSIHFGGSDVNLKHTVCLGPDARSLVYLISDSSTASEASEKLQTYFERDTVANKLFHKKRYFRTVMDSKAPP